MPSAPGGRSWVFLQPSPTSQDRALGPRRLPAQDFGFCRWKTVPLHQKVCISDVTPDFFKKLFDNKHCQAQLQPRPGRHRFVIFQRCWGRWKFFLSLDFSPESSGTLEHDRIEPHVLAVLRAVMGLVVVLGPGFVVCF